MKKGIKKGALVTFFAYEYGHMIYGIIVIYLGHNMWAVEGSWGLSQFHQATMRVVRR